MSDETISDGFGSTWPKYCHCGGLNQIMRPGKIQCSKQGLPQHDNYDQGISRCNCLYCKKIREFTRPKERASIRAEAERLTLFAAKRYGSSQVNPHLQMEVVREIEAALLRGKREENEERR